MFRQAFGLLLKGIRWICCWLPALLAMATFTEAYYAYLIVFCGRYVKEDPLRFALATVFHLLLLMCLWSYAQTTFTHAPSVPRFFHLTKNECQALVRCTQDGNRRCALLETMASERGVLTRLAGGGVSCCESCQLIKPDRCHHCSACKRCVQKMDHHCPWFNNCVCFSTYKFFLLTLFYSAFLAAYVLASVSIYLLHKSPRRRLLHRSRHISFLVVMGGAMSAMLAVFLGIHMSLVIRNATTLESMRAPNFKQRGDSFNLGCYRNCLEVFGLYIVLWLVPVFTSLGDGCHFPTKLHPDGTYSVVVGSSQRAASVDAAAAPDAGAGGEAGLQEASSTATALKKDSASLMGEDVTRAGCPSTALDTMAQTARPPSGAESLEAIGVGPRKSSSSAKYPSCAVAQATNNDAAPAELVGSQARRSALRQTRSLPSARRLE
ncbi:palmitoyltransferase ZDHHC20-B-like [Dermacentor andersoni]|uniref:palmitoyltransferase ZDHHC20-B-like n=1 Tax=Dermacentor andersoni TaxID=34620 RepID=UPI0024167CD5|nr:palmitoyltransferase ZDHHC20-B-like [Dermacentor andersoni]